MSGKSIRKRLEGALEEPAMFELLEIMNALKLDEIRAAAQTPAQQIKLRENLSIETMGPKVYQRFLVPLYREILGILKESGKRIQVHYDGQLGVIADDIAALDIDGIDSFTEAPEGDMTLEQARARWPEKLLWAHPNLGWYSQSREELAAQIRRAARAAGPTRFCFQISEDVPPEWQETVPVVLETLRSLKG